jgi:ABC-type phosphate/phosphonate transport system substrate-binding protein
MAAALAVGCADEFSTSVWDPSNSGKNPASQAPLRIGVAWAAEESGASVLNPATWLSSKQTPWLSFQKKLAKQLGRPVVIESYEPFQIEVHIQSGRIQFAWMPAVDYLQLARESDMGRVIAISVNGQRTGLIVTAAKSNVQSISDLKGRRFAFGPKDDPVLHTAALVVLEQGGVTADDLAKEVLPVPGSSQHHSSSSEAAKEVVYGLSVGDLGTAGGVIEESDYLALPQTGGKLLPMSLSKDQFRILGRTESVAIDTIDSGPVLAARSADPQLVTVVQKFMFSAPTDNPDVLRDLGLASFDQPPPSVSACKSLLREMAVNQTPAPIPE